MSEPLSRQTRAIVALAGAIAAGEEVVLAKCVAEAIDAGTTAAVIDELVLQSVLTVGWPKALVAAGYCRAALGPFAAEADADTDYSRHAAWTARGEASCKVIYGDHYEKLRANVRQLHPALEAWMVTEGYGRTLSRPGLDLKTRELCTVAQTMVLRTPRQLHSHLRGALNAGAGRDEIAVTLEITRPLVSADEWQTVDALWRRVREAKGGVA